MFLLRHLRGITCLLLITSCSDTPIQSNVEDLSYFDLKGYFENEANNLNGRNPFVIKKVYKNTQSEIKELTIIDWQKELSLFIESDINKPSWKTSYLLERSNDTIHYKALNGELRTKEIKIVKLADKVRSIFIENSVINELYQSNEKLYYYPDSLYRIVKQQRVRVIGENSYEIIGKLKKAN